MAKIIHKGMWIDIKSLNAEDKKNFLASMAFAFLASILLGIHLSFIGILGSEPMPDGGISEPIILALRITMILLFVIATYFYKKFYE